MFSFLGTKAAFYFGKRAAKAVIAAVTAGTGTAAVAITQACDIDAALGPYIGTAGVALTSYLLTYLIPNKSACTWIIYI